MNRRPHEPLDAEERALAATLPRPHGRSEPGGDLDARILAAARAATEPARAKPASRRRSWIAPTAVAASLMLAVGLAWQLRPPASLEAGAQAEATASAAADADNDAMMVRSIEAPPLPADAAAPTVESVPMKPMPQPAQSLPSTQVARAPVPPPPAEPAIGAIAATPPPPAPTAPVLADSPVVTSMPAPQAAEAARMAPPPAMAKSTRADGLVRERATAAGNAAAREQDKAAMAADATTLDTITVADPQAEEPDEDVPPATADSPEVRDAWLRRIGELLKQGKADDAKASLAEFRRRYPDAVLPQELRKLEH